MSNRFGIIAEDQSDVDSIRVILRRLLKKDNISSERFLGKGCGKIRRKCSAWADNLKRKGCNVLLVVHDQDRFGRSDLRKSIEAALTPSPIKQYFICIPKEELEGWMLADSGSLKKALKLKKDLPICHHPEEVASPKETICDMVDKASRGEKTFVHTRHNEVVFRSIDLKILARKCPSFAELEIFVSALDGSTQHK